jgi:hypothetical protein
MHYYTNYLVKTFLCLLGSLISINNYAQSNTGIHFQGIARNAQGFVLANKKLNLQLSILSDSVSENILYQEVKAVTTNVVGLFFTNIGSVESGKLITIGNFDTISWNQGQHYLQVAVDIENDLNFTNLGTELITGVPIAFFANKVEANGINGIIQLAQGGTGVTNLKALKSLLEIDKINNTPDSSKMTNKTTLQLINDKLNKIDTASLSNRINLKLQKTDTLSLSGRINLKMNKTDTLSLSSRINQKMELTEITDSVIFERLGYQPAAIEFGSFYDTSKQSNAVNTATAILWGFSGNNQNINITNNSSLLPTKIMVTHGGTYRVSYALQGIKTDIGNDEMSVWIRKNGAAYPFTNKLYQVIGGNSKNSLMATYFIELKDKDYLELFFSIKNSNTSLMGTGILTTPARPAIPSASIFIDKLN